MPKLPQSLALAGRLVFMCRELMTQIVTVCITVAPLAAQTLTKQCPILSVAHFEATLSFDLTPSMWFKHQTGVAIMEILGPRQNTEQTSS